MCWIIQYRDRMPWPLKRPLNRMHALIFWQVVRRIWYVIKFDKILVNLWLTVFCIYVYNDASATLPKPAYENVFTDPQIENLLKMIQKFKFDEQSPESPN